MMQIPDDPVIRCIERTGYAPWYLADRGYFDEYEEDEYIEDDEYEDCEEDEDADF